MIHIKIPKRFFFKRKIKKIKKMNKKIRNLAKKNKFEQVEIVNKKLTALFSKNILNTLFKVKYKKSALNKADLNFFYMPEKVFEKLTNYDKKIMRIRYSKIYLTNKPSVLKMNDWNQYIIDNSLNKKIQLKEDNK